MTRRKNTKRIDPRYFLNETVNRCESCGHAQELEEGFGTALRGFAGAGKAAVQKMAGHGGAADMVQTEKQIQRLVADHLSASGSPRLTLQMLQGILAPLTAQVKEKEEEF
jgi:hypothetical protein|tara:strand:+ start:4586 stop:4915 length:330 start_codon:yes stop_codon:yes gene_type:complete